MMPALCGLRIEPAGPEAGSPIAPVLAALADDLATAGTIGSPPAHPIPALARAAVDLALEDEGVPAGSSPAIRAAALLVAALAHEELVAQAEEPAAAARVADSAVGTIGAAVAVALARELDPPQIADAIGLAASSASAVGADTVGPAADAGRLAALLAAAGWDAPATALEGRKGLAVLVRRTSPTDPADSDLAHRLARTTLDTARDAAGDTRVLDAARLAFGNAASLILAAAEEPPILAAGAELAAEPGRPARMLGRTGWMGAPAAALLQGAAGHLEDFDDTHPPTVVHPGVPVAAAVLALADASGASGRDALIAFAAGVESALRVGELVPDALQRGWHQTGIAGPVGAAVAAALLLDLDEARVVAAIDAAAARSAGITEALGTLAKPMHVGAAARAGVLAATGDEPNRPGCGLAALVVTLGGNPAADVSAGSARILDNVIKPAACGVLGHSSIEAALVLRTERTDTPAEVELRVSPLAVTAMGRTDPRDGRAAKFSLPHVFAAAFRFGDADPGRFSDAVAVDPGVTVVRDRVRLIADDDCQRYEARARAVWADGTVREFTIPAAAPPSVDAVRAKARRLLAGRAGAGAFIDAAFEVDRLPRLADLHDLAPPTRG